MKPIRYLRFLQGGRRGGVGGVAIAAHHLDGGKLAHHFLGNRFGGPLGNYQHPMRLAVDKDRAGGRRLPLPQIDIIDGYDADIVPLQVVRDDHRALSFHQAQDRFATDSNAHRPERSCQGVGTRI